MQQFSAVVVITLLAGLVGFLIWKIYEISNRRDVMYKSTGTTAWTPAFKSLLSTIVHGVVYVWVVPLPSDIVSDECLQELIPKIITSIESNHTPDQFMGEYRDDEVYDSILKILNHVLNNCITEWDLFKTAVFKQYVASRLAEVDCAPSNDLYKNGINAGINAIPEKYTVAEILILEFSPKRADILHGIVDNAIGDSCQT